MSLTEITLQLCRTGLKLSDDLRLLLDISSSFTFRKDRGRKESIKLPDAYKHCMLGRFMMLSILISLFLLMSKVWIVRTLGRTSFFNELFAMFSICKNGGMLEMSEIAL